MSDVYLGNPPPGEVRSLTEPPTRQPEILAVGIATTCIAAVVVCLRFYTRLTIVRESITIDDYFVLISLLLTVTTIVLNSKPEDYVFSYLETNAGIICASVPALRPFFLRFLPALVTSSFSSSDRNTSTSQPRISCGLSSVVEQNRQRRMMQQSSYELFSIDENMMQPSEDDEIKLWSPGRKEGAVKDNTKSKDRDPENNSLETLEDLTPARVRGVNETTISSGPSHPVHGGGIQVQHETSINYEG
ncbi:hypothetical protein DL766_009415 [Monosporascus sp. MC13-8B]|uniref:Integral membrane protein n=1 Tax=Monosporascus cannonballus TaxID=155416 RepID=A0ABY0H509_9PEZI|nr:hypothetical protein DL762_005395 [Monosporascus cannonballus]RYP00646.1 hypothetical protein DL763_000700 [Monosporascus cannonballus]RYP15418.1 hypothetical protein DL766_009415 [Monosporascus sp. MC13-8B]